MDCFCKSHSSLSFTRAYQTWLLCVAALCPWSLVLTGQPVQLVADLSLTLELGEMGTRIDDLEKNVAELMTQAGMEEQAASKWQQAVGWSLPMKPSKSEHFGCLPNSDVT